MEGDIMSYPKAYQPEQGYKYQLLCRAKIYNGRTWEHCDYAKDIKDLHFLKKEYQLCYGCNFEFKRILLPLKYHKAI